MPQYEINVWRDTELISKEVTYFETSESCAVYVRDKYGGPDSWTNIRNSNGKLRWHLKRGFRTTWGKLPEYSYEPKRMLREEDKILQKKLDDSITPETIKEFEGDLFKDMTRKEFYSNPGSKGYEDKK